MVPKPVPFDATEVMVTGALPLDVSVSVLTENEFTAALPKFSLEASTVSAGVGEPFHEPLSGNGNAANGILICSTEPKMPGAPVRSELIAASTSLPASRTPEPAGADDNRRSVEPVLEKLEQKAVPPPQAHRT
jgi:hypothetical protein